MFEHAEEGGNEGMEGEADKGGGRRMVRERRLKEKEQV